MNESRDNYYQLWILNTDLNQFQKSGPLLTYPQGLTWLNTLRQHFDRREMRLAPEVTPASFIVTETTVWPGEG